MSKVNEWVNYGDVNPVEHGAVFVKRDSEVSGRQFYVVSVYRFDSSKWQLIDGYIDLDDTWIDWNAVKVTMGTSENADNESLAVDCMHYYGNNLSNGEVEIFESEKRVRERLERLEITV